MLDTLLFSYTLKGQQIKLNHADSKELSKAVPSVLDLSSKMSICFGMADPLINENSNDMI